MFHHHPTHTHVLFFCFLFSFFFCAYWLHSITRPNTRFYYWLLLIQWPAFVPFFSGCSQSQGQSNEKKDRESVRINKQTLGILPFLPTPIIKRLTVCNIASSYQHLISCFFLKHKKNLLFVPKCRRLVKMSSDVTNQSCDCAWTLVEMSSDVTDQSYD